ncbi:MAG: hypothetical protein F4123_02315, partial [Gemmatimonadetes bacterium]|nr:hypothetical protein [Gemmatimonadota bacterium]
MTIRTTHTATPLAVTAAIPLVLLVLATSPTNAQDTAGNVFHDGASLPWGELNNGVRMLPLYG